MSTTLVSPMRALTQCSLQTAIMSLRNLWLYWVMHFERFAPGDDLSCSIVDLDHTKVSPVKPRWNDSRSPFQ
jgi:hypothetical protein